MNTEEKQKLIEDLHKELQTIEAELNRIAVKNGQVPDDYMATFPAEATESDSNDDRARDLEEWERKRAIEQQLELKRKEIKETLEKIESGDYGLCTHCNSPIEDARLKAMPIASFCSDCARKVTLA